MTEKYFYVHKVAQIRNCSKHHVYRLIQNGDLEAIRLEAHALKITGSSLREFIRSRKVDPQEYFA